MENIDSYWNKFLTEKKIDKEIYFAGLISFGTTEKETNEFLSLILNGEKTANVSALESFTLDTEILPQKDYYYILVDWAEKAQAIIKTTNVRILPYKNITWDIARKEGGYENMQIWSDSHNEFFEEDSDIMGYEFTPDTPIVFEEFEVVYRF